MVRLGIDTLIDERSDVLRGKRLGLISNHSGVNSDFQPTINVLNDYDAFALQKLFAPEHGLWGTAASGEEVEDRTDESTGLPVISLYGTEGNPEGRPLEPWMIEDLDAVLFDLQDVGCRYFTMIYTLAAVLVGVAEADKEVYVLDRPNPIAPLGVDGNRVPREHSSFVSGYRLPIIYGMTIGELAQYFNDEFDIGADLEVIEMEGWERDVWYTETELAWVYPSQNMPTIRTATIYPGTCFFEKVNISEGKGTTRPFELIGAPWIDGNEWAEQLTNEDLPGVRFKPTQFKPSRPPEAFSLYDGETVEGVQVAVLDRDVFDPLRVGLTMLTSAFVNYPQCTYVKFGDTYIIDRIAGGDYLRKTIDDLDETDDVSEVVDALVERWDDDVAEFVDLQEQYHLY